MIIRRRVIFAALLASGLGLVAAGGFAASAFFADDGGAIRGYDPVAYFTEQEPVEGSPDITYEYEGATWHFASAQNRDRFVAEPQAYAPRYGGYCAWAVSQGYTAPIDPEAWKIVDGRLYLNYSREVQATWSQDIPGNIAKADENWPKLQDKQ
jgi:YHS domain-containing protein